MFSAGGGIARIAGTDGTNFNQAKGFSLGIAKAMTAQPEEKFDHGVPLPSRKWRFFANLNFLFDQAAIKQSALQQAIIANPQNTAILSATSGSGRFYTLTFEPTLRVALGSRATVYFFAGFGAIRRTVDLTGASINGSLVEPSSPAAFRPSSNSGALGGGLGVDVLVSKSAGGLKIFGELRVVQGLAVNHTTTRIPVTAGIRW